MDFRQISLGDKERIEQYVSRYGENSCQYSFPAMFCLQSKYGDRICEKEGWLFILRSALCGERYRTYLFPLGGGSPEQAMSLLEGDAREHHALIRFETATEGQKRILDSCCPGRFNGSEKRDLAEYIYSRERIASQEGSFLQSRRRECRIFRREYGAAAEVSAIVPGDIPEILRFQGYWMQQHRTDPDRDELLQEDESIRIAFSNFSELGMAGIVLRIDGAVRGYSIGCRISPDCFDERNEKCDIHFTGIYSEVKQKTAAAAQTRYLNWEEDLGNPGLRSFKMTYKPEILLKKYILTEVPTVE
jgi:hypothetical protein